jgi:DNA-binding GntR family transcriptional regulator
MLWRDSISIMTQRDDPTRRSINRSSPIPLYVQIARDIELSVKGGELAPGSLLDAEVTLAKNFAVSRPTIRAAIAYLVERGLLVKHRRIGNVVAPEPVSRDITISPYDHLYAEGRDPRTEVLLFEEAAADEVLHEAWGTAPATVIHIRRLRYEGDTPIALMDNMVAPQLVRFTAADLERTGLYVLLRAAGAKITNGKLSLRARPSTKEESRLLRLRHPACMLEQLRDSFDASGLPVERGHHVYPGERYSFEGVFSGGVTIPVSSPPMSSSRFSQSGM